MYKTLLSLSLFFITQLLAAETAEDYFHRGAQFYIWNQKQRATNEIFSGLRLFPSDQKLNALAGLLKKEEDQKQQQQHQEQNQQNDQSKQDQQQQQQQQQNQNDQKQNASQSKPQNQQDNQNQQQQQAAKAAEDQKQKEQQAAEAASQQKEQSGETNEQEVAAGQMTPEQARQLLDAQKGDEKMLQMRQDGKTADRAKPLHDW